MLDQLIVALTDSYVDEAREAAETRASLRVEAMTDQVEAARSASLATLRHVVRSMNDIFKALQKGEDSWRTAVYAGDAPYRLADDEIRVAGYRRWAESAREIATVAASLESSGRRIRGLNALRRRVDQIAPVERPGARLMDFPRIGREVDPKSLRIRSRSEWLAANPQHDARPRPDDDDVCPLSDYLLSRDS